MLITLVGNVLLHKIYKAHLNMSSYYQNKDVENIIYIYYIRL
jgi:hypothetical protein